MVERKLVHELLFGIQERLLHERLAHAMSRAVASGELAFELAALIEEHVRDVVAIPMWNRDAEEGVAHEADLVVLPRSSAVHRTDGTLAPPPTWPKGTVAVELSEIRLANGTGGARGYDGVLEHLRADLAAKSADDNRREATWLGLSVMTDAAWAGTPAKAEGERVAREVRIDRWRPCPAGLLCIGSVFGSMAYGAWKGDVWVEVFVPTIVRTPPAASLPRGAGLRAHPPSALAGDGRASLSWYATHAEGGAELDGEAAGPRELGVETQVLHEHRRDQYERLGRWGGTFDELRLCLFMEARLWESARAAAGGERGRGGAFEQVPGVSQLASELRAAWDARPVCDDAK